MSRLPIDVDHARLPVRHTITIMDVAQRAGVSKASVSRFLSGRTELLSEPIWHQIEQAVAALGYQPNQMARSLKGGQTKLIGMIVADVENPYSVAVLRGAESECRRAGYLLALCNSGGSLKVERDLLAALRAYRIEGLILNTAGRGARHVSDAMPEELPVMLLDRRLPSGRFDFVGLDNTTAAVMATRHLIDNGYRDLALVLEPGEGVSVRTERVQGFRQTVQQAGVRGEVIEVEAGEPAALRAGLTGFSANRRRRRTAVIAGSGLMTLRVVQQLQSLGLGIPDDIGLVGFDELEWSALIGPGITTVAQPTHEIGVAAVRGLLARLKGEQSGPTNTIFPGALIVRGSSAPRG